MENNQKNLINMSYEEMCKYDLIGFNYTMQSQIPVPEKIINIK